MENKKRFSVIVIAYNIEDYIKNAIESVEKQTFKNYELIVVDDCSTDHTKQVILEQQATYNNFTFIQHEVNKNLGGARNTALDSATGEYILFLDGDDTFADRTVFEKLDKVIGEDSPDIVYMGFEMKGMIQKVLIPTLENSTKHWRTAQDPYPNVWSKCWRREYLEENKIRFPEKRFYEDVLFTYKGVMNAKETKIADFVVHNYFSGRPNSITTAPTLKNIDDTIQNLKDLLYLKEIEPTEELNYIIKREFRLCRKRLDDIEKSMDFCD